MSQRLDALRSKLPGGVIFIIRRFDSHPVADMIRAIEFERYPGHLYAAASLRLTKCDLWAPLAREMNRRVRHNSTLMSQTKGVWQPVLCYDAKIWLLSFPRWKFETLEDLEYLPLWVKEEYMLKVH